MTTYKVISSYSFWGEPDRSSHLSFNSLWRAFDYIQESDQFDTEYDLVRAVDGEYREVDLRWLYRQELKHYDRGES